MAFLAFRRVFFPRLLLASFKIQAMVAIGYVLMGAFIESVPRNLNLNAALAAIHHRRPSQ